MLQLIFIVVASFVLGSIVTLRVLPLVSPLYLSDGKILCGTREQVLAMLPPRGSGEGVHGDMRFDFITTEEPVPVELRALMLTAVREALPAIEDGVAKGAANGISPTLVLRSNKPHLAPGRYRTFFFYHLYWKKV